MSERPSILACDGGRRSVHALRTVLRDAGFTVDATGAAEESLDHAASRVLDAAIVELELPDVSAPSTASATDSLRAAVT